MLAGPLLLIFVEHVEHPKLSTALTYAVHVSLLASSYAHAKIKISIASLYITRAITDMLNVASSNSYIVGPLPRHRA